MNYIINCIEYYSKHFVEKNKKWIELGFFVFFIILFFIPQAYHPLLNGNVYPLTLIFYLTKLNLHNPLTAEQWIILINDAVIFICFLILFVIAFFIVVSKSKKMIFLYLSYLPISIYASIIFTISCGIQYNLLINIYVYIAFILVYILFRIYYILIRHIDIKRPTKKDRIKALEEKIKKIENSDN